MYEALQHAASFHFPIEHWKDCEELKPKPKEKLSFVDKRSEGMISGIRCAAKMGFLPRQGPANPSEVGVVFLFFFFLKR